MRNLLLHAALLTSIGLSAQSTPSFYWKLDEIAGTLAHDFMDASDGTVQGNCTWQPTSGYFSGALRCYGNDARVNLGPCDITTGTGDQISLACWFKPEIVSATERVLMAKTTGPNAADFMWSLSLINGTGARFRIRAGGVLTTIEIPSSSIFSGTWYHLAATYNGHTLRLFLNGTTIANGTASGTLGYHPEAPATLGNMVDNSMPFYGSLDDARIYDHALTGLEVIDLVLGDVMTSVDDRTIGVRPDGALQLPPGEWSDLRIMDASGRALSSEPIDMGHSPSISDLPAGLYLVCLQGHEGTLTRPVVKP